MKIRHFIFLLLLLPLTGCGFLSDPVEPLVYYTYGNATDKTITVKTLQDDQTTIVSSFTIAPGEEFTYPVRLDYYYRPPFGCYYVSVSNGESLFIQHDEDPCFSYYLFLLDLYQITRIKRDEVFNRQIDKVIYYKYVFSDKDFLESSGNNIIEVTN